MDIIECFINKMKRIINFKEFYKEAREYFDEFYYENDQDEDITYNDTIQYLYRRYFNKFEYEYNLLDEAEYEFWDFIIELYEPTIYPMFNVVFRKK